LLLLLCLLLLCLLLLFCLLLLLLLQPLCLLLLLLLFAVLDPRRAPGAGCWCSALQVLLQHII
jgi:hypothetical protein